MAELKDYIKQQYSDELIFSLYLEVDIEDILYCLQKRTNKIVNHFRGEQDASLSFIRYGDKVVARDWGDIRFRGDIFEIAGVVLGLNCNDKMSFIKICYDIIDRCSHANKPDLKKEYVKEQQLIANRNFDIEVIARRPNRFDYQYFSDYGTVRKIVDNAIIVVDRYKIDDRMSPYKYGIFDPCYCYIVNPNGKKKLYFPNRKKGGELPRFLTNNKISVENIDLHTTYKSVGLITKSQKDRFLLERIIKYIRLDDKIGVIVSSSENIAFEKPILEHLTKVYDKLYTLFDNDLAGIEAGKRFYKDYGFEPKLVGSMYVTKDISDFYKKYGFDKTIREFKSLELC